MPHILSNLFSKDAKGIWGEGAPYESKVIYDIHHQSPTSPPVHYEAHLLKPHSLPHFDAPAHIIENGKTVDHYYQNNQLDGFFGKVLMIRLKGDHFKQHSSNPNILVWTVTKEEIMKYVLESANTKPSRILLTFDEYPLDDCGNHDQNKVLVLDEAAAQWLLENNPKFCMYGTSWKSTDFQPGSKERPIHKIFFKHDTLIFECLNLKEVSNGEYYWFAFPLPLEGASESPVCPVLFTKQELMNLL